MDKTCQGASRAEKQHHRGDRGVANFGGAEELGMEHVDPSWRFGKPWWLVVFSNDDLSSGYVKIAIENDHRNSGFSQL